MPLWAISGPEQKLKFLAAAVVVVIVTRRRTIAGAARRRASIGYVAAWATGRASVRYSATWATRYRASISTARKHCAGIAAGCKDLARL